MNAKTYNEEVKNKFEGGKYDEQLGHISLTHHKIITGDLNTDGYEQKKGECFQIPGYTVLKKQSE